jgi:hypothetical protein
VFLNRRAAINYTGPSSYRKKNLPGRGLTKVENHCFRGFTVSQPRFEMTTFKTKVRLFNTEPTCYILLRITTALYAEWARNTWRIYISFKKNNLTKRIASNSKQFHENSLQCLGPEKNATTVTTLSCTYADKPKRLCWKSKWLGIRNCKRRGKRWWPILN